MKKMYVSKNKRSRGNNISLIFRKRICAICEKNGLGKSYNLYLSGNRVIRCHAFCIQGKGGLAEAVTFLEKKLRGKFYFNSDLK